MKKGQTSIRDGIEDILFPMEHCRITQGDNGSYSHKGAYAVDLAGKDATLEYAYFPFSAKSVYLGNTATEGNAVIWESLNKVRFADGTIDYACMLVVHDNDPRGFEVGKQYKQGTQMAREGTAGKASGAHLHIEVARGKYTGKAYEKNQYGVYELPNNRPIETACFMDNTEILVGKANWKYLKDVPIKPPTPPAPTTVTIPKTEYDALNAKVKVLTDECNRLTKEVADLTSKIKKVKEVVG